MRKLFVFIVLCLLLVACDGDGDTSKIGPEPFIGGSSGLEASFEPMGIEESGLYTIYEDESFPIQIILKNKGESDVNPGDVKLRLYGIPLSDFSGISSNQLSNVQKIEKISEFNPDGTEEIVNYASNAKYVQEVPGSFYDANIFASFTYKYQTQAIVPEVCFKENLRDDRVCKVEETKKVFSSAAPVQVKSIEEKPAGTGIIELDFEVENVGGGDVTKPGVDFALRYGQLIYHIEPSSERAKWKCTHGGRDNEARLVDNKATIRCKLVSPLEKDALYTKQIGLVLEYDYRDIIDETVRIQKAIS